MKQKPKPKGKPENPAPTLVHSDKRREYFKLLEMHNRNRIDYNDRKWETIKFGQTIVGAVYVTTIALTLTAANLHLLQRWWVTPLIVLLLLMGVSTCVVTIRNLRRESRHLFVEEGTMFKIARVLNLDIQLSAEKQWIEHDEHLLPKKWRDSAHGIQEEAQNQRPAFERWAEARTKEHAFWLDYRRLFTVFILFGIVAMAVVIILGVTAERPNDDGVGNQQVRLKPVDSFDKLNPNVRRFVLPDQDGSGTEVYVSLSHAERSAPVIRVFVDPERAEREAEPHGAKADADPKRDNP